MVAFPRYGDATARACPAGPATRPPGQFRVSAGTVVDRHVRSTPGPRLVLAGPGRPPGWACAPPRSDGAPVPMEAAVPCGTSVPAAGRDVLSRRPHHFIDIICAALSVANSRCVSAVAYSLQPVNYATNFGATALSPRIMALRALERITRAAIEGCSVRRGARGACGRGHKPCGAAGTTEALAPEAGQQAGPRRKRGRSRPAVCAGKLTASAEVPVVPNSFAFSLPWCPRIPKVATRAAHHPCACTRSGFATC